MSYYIYGPSYIFCHFLNIKFWLPQIFKFYPQFPEFSIYNNVNELANHILLICDDLNYFYFQYSFISYIWNHGIRIPVVNKERGLYFIKFKEYLYVYC
jgi:hypothetical protein